MSLGASGHFATVGDIDPGNAAAILGGGHIRSRGKGCKHTGGTGIRSGKHVESIGSGRKQSPARLEQFGLHQKKEVCRKITTPGTLHRDARGQSGDEVEAILGLCRNRPAKSSDSQEIGRVFHVHQ